jgi:CHAD domain-containing protein
VTDKPAQLKPGMTPEAGFRRVAAMCCEAFSAQLAQVMTGEDPEGPHRARVALRRFRSALAGFSPVIEPAARREMAGQARGLFRVLGRLRDADVLLAGCVDPAAVAGLSAETDQVRAEVREALTAMGAAGFCPAILNRLADRDWQRHDRRGRRWHRRGLDRLGRRALDRAWQACLDHGTDLAALAAEPRHELRKDLKTLRYLSEYFAPFWPGGRRDRFLAHLRVLQDHLGTLNDLALARTPDADPASDPASDPAPTEAEAATLTAAAREWEGLIKAGVWWA